MARSVNGFVGTYSSLAAITAARFPADYAGCSANIGTGIPYDKAWCNGVSWYVVGAGSTSNPNIIQITADTSGTTNTSAAFIAAVQAVADSTTFGNSGLSDPASKKIIEIPPGQYLITQINGMLGQETHPIKTSSLIFRGAGRGATQIIFQPASAGALCTNNKWLDVQFEGIEFIAKTAGCTLFTTPGTSNEQEYTFEKCSFYNFKYVMNLLGDNNNSEVLFNRCSNYAMEQSGAWLYMGASGTSDQFLNYWFNEAKHWSTSAPLIDSAKGGHFHIKNLDASDWGSAAVASPATPDQGTYLIKLRGTSHSFGVLSLTAHVLRGEFKNNNAKLLYTEWGDYGQITLDGVDLSSQLFNGTTGYTYGSQMVYVKVPDADGAKVTIRDSQMAGGITVAYTDSAWSRKSRIEVVGGAWWQKTSPSDVVTYVNGGSNPNPPIVLFENVRPASNPAYNFTSATAYAVWDAAIGSVGVPGATYPATNSEAQKRCVRVNSVYGGVKGGQTAYIKVPLGAIITDFRVSAHPGATSEADGGTWTLESDKAGTPTTVSTVVVAGALSAGFNQGGAITPYKCSNAAKTILAVTTTNVSSVIDNEITVEIGGYW